MKKNSVHFIGIGGIGVSAIARLLLAEGKAVSGSDVADSKLIDELRKIGTKVRISNKQKIGDIPKNTDLIIYSTAIEVADPKFFNLTTILL